MRKQQKGFSLIELLIVVAIILIIAAIAIPNLMRARIKFGIAMAAITRIIATTISSSMSEKPFCLCMALVPVVHLQLHLHFGRQPPKPMGTTQKVEALKRPNLSTLAWLPQSQVSLLSVGGRKEEKGRRICIRRPLAYTLPQSTRQTQSTV